LCVAGKLPSLEAIEGITYTPHRHHVRILRRDILEQGGYQAKEEEEEEKEKAKGGDKNAKAKKKQ
jgi:hypothetical protein